MQSAVYMSYMYSNEYNNKMLDNEKVCWWSTSCTWFLYKKAVQVGPSDPDGSQEQCAECLCRFLEGFILTVDAVTHQMFTLEEITKEAIFYCLSEELL